MRPSEECLLHPILRTPLVTVLDDVAHGSPPRSDGTVEVLPSLGLGQDDVVLATDGHLTITSDVDPDEVRRHFAPGDLSGWSDPAAVVWLCARTGRRPGTGDIVLVATGAGGVAVDLVPFVGAHPRLTAAGHHRTELEAWTTVGGAGLVAVGRGLAGRWEVAYEVDPAHRGRGIGAVLARAARALVPAGAPLWAQAPPGNVSSVRTLLRAGFVPVGGEVLLRPTAR